MYFYLYVFLYVLYFILILRSTNVHNIIISTRNSSVNEIGERYLLNHAIVVKLYHPYTQLTPSDS